MGKVERLEIESVSELDRLTLALAVEQARSASLEAKLANAVSVQAASALDAEKERLKVGYGLEGEDSIDLKTGRITRSRRSS